MRPIAAATALCGVAMALGCAFDTTATANRVAVPVLVGPVEQIGGGAAGDEEGPTFDVKVDRAFTASSSSQTTGNVTVTKTTTTYQQDGAGRVDAGVRSAAGGQNDHIIKVDKLRVNAYSGFFYSAAWISSRVRVKGHVGRKIKSPRRAQPAPAPAPPPEAIEPEAVEPEAIEPEAVEPEAIEPDAVEPDKPAPPPTTRDGKLISDPFATQ